MTDFSEAKAAWDRLQNRERASWSDWLCVGEALVVIRAKAMALSRCNRPVGGAYNRAAGQLLREAGLADVTAPERYKILQVIEKRAEVEAWLLTLTPEKRRCHNHPSSVWGGWRRAMRPTQTPASDAPRRAPVAAKLDNCRLGGRPVYWSQDAVRRAHQAMLDSRSSDLLTLARSALHGAIRGEDDLLELLEQPKPTTTAKQVKPKTLPVSTSLVL